MIRTVIAKWRGREIARWDDVAVDPIGATHQGEAAGHELFAAVGRRRLQAAHVAETVIAEVQFVTISFLASEQAVST